MNINEIKNEVLSNSYVKIKDNRKLNQYQKSVIENPTMSNIKKVVAELKKIGRNKGLAGSDLKSYVFSRLHHTINRGWIEIAFN